VIADTPEMIAADRLAVVQPFDPKTFYSRFEHRRLRTPAGEVHAVVGGEGPPLLLHGWPATWSHWRRVMPRLAERHRVIAVDMPGFGDSPAPPSAEKVEVARTLRTVCEALKAPRLSILSHDMGGTVAYAYAALFPEAVEGLILSETAVPGFGFAGGEADLLVPTAQSVAGIWHFTFFMREALPEMLVAGRERAFVRAMTLGHFSNPAAWGVEEEDDLVAWLSAPGGLSGGLAYYRALFRDAETNRRLAERKLTLPVLLLTGADGFLAGPAGASVRAVAEQVQQDEIARSGHFIARERPGLLAERVLAFLEDGR
jgi:pimeloyl-ACP methyl ester carboxylesterase